MRISGLRRNYNCPRQRRVTDYCEHVFSDGTGTFLALYEQLPLLMCRGVSPFVAPTPPSNLERRRHITLMTGADPCHQTIIQRIQGYDPCIRCLGDIIHFVNSDILNQRFKVIFLTSLKVILLTASSQQLKKRLSALFLTNISVFLNNILFQRLNRHKRSANNGC